MAVRPSNISNKPIILDLVASSEDSNIILSFSHRQYYETSLTSSSAIISEAFPYFSRSKALHFAFKTDNSNTHVTDISDRKLSIEPNGSIIFNPTNKIATESTSASIRVNGYENDTFGPQIGTRSLRNTVLPIISELERNMFIDIRAGFGRSHAGILFSNPNQHTGGGLHNERAKTGIIVVGRDNNGDTFHRADRMIFCFDNNETHTRDRNDISGLINSAKVTFEHDGTIHCRKLHVTDISDRKLSIEPNGSIIFNPTNKIATESTSASIRVNGYENDTFGPQIGTRSLRNTVLPIISELERNMFIDIRAGFGRSHAGILFSNPNQHTGGGLHNERAKTGIIVVGRDNNGDTFHRADRMIFCFDNNETHTRERNDINGLINSAKVTFEHDGTIRCRKLIATDGSFLIPLRQGLISKARTAANRNARQPDVGNTRQHIKEFTTYITRWSEQGFQTPDISSIAAQNTNRCHLDIRTRSSGAISALLFGNNSIIRNVNELDNNSKFLVNHVDENLRISVGKNASKTGIFTIPLIKPRAYNLTSVGYDNEFMVGGQTGGDDGANNFGYGNRSALMVFAFNTRHDLKDQLVSPNIQDSRVAIDYNGNIQLGVHKNRNDPNTCRFVNEYLNNDLTRKADNDIHPDNADNFVLEDDMDRIISHRPDRLLPVYAMHDWENTISIDDYYDVRTDYPPRLTILSNYRNDATQSREFFGIDIRRFRGFTGHSDIRFRDSTGITFGTHGTSGNQRFGVSNDNFIPSCAGITVTKRTDTSDDHTAHSFRFSFSENTSRSLLPHDDSKFEIDHRGNLRICPNHSGSGAGAGNVADNVTEGEQNLSSLNNSIIVGNHVDDSLGVYIGNQQNRNKILSIISRYQRNMFLDIRSGFRRSHVGITFGTPNGGGINHPSRSGIIVSGDPLDNAPAASAADVMSFCLDGTSSEGNRLDPNFLIRNNKRFEIDSRGNLRINPVRNRGTTGDNDRALRTHGNPVNFDNINVRNCIRVGGNYYNNSNNPDPNMDTPSVIVDDLPTNNSILSFISDTNRSLFLDIRSGAGRSHAGITFATTTGGNTDHASRAGIIVRGLNINGDVDSMNFSINYNGTGLGNRLDPNHLFDPAIGSIRYRINRYQHRFIVTANDGNGHNSGPTTGQVVIAGSSQQDMALSFVHSNFALHNLPLTRSAKTAIVSQGGGIRGAQEQSGQDRSLSLEFCMDNRTGSTAADTLERSSLSIINGMRNIIDNKPMGYNDPWNSKAVVVRGDSDQGTRLFIHGKSSMVEGASLQFSFAYTGGNGSTGHPEYANSLRTANNTNEQNFVDDNQVIGTAAIFATPILNSVSRYNSNYKKASRLVFAISDETTRLVNGENSSIKHVKLGDAILELTNQRTATFYAVISERSDDRVKHNEENINNGLETMRLLNPMVYDKSYPTRESRYLGDLSNCTLKREAGLIAQDLLNTNLNYVVQGGDYYDSSNNLIEDIYTVQYNCIHIYTIAAVKELDTIVQSQQTTITSLNNKIQNLENENNIIKTALNQLLSQAGINTI